MKLVLFALLSFLASCSSVTDNLDYPKRIEDVLEVELLRPDEKTNGEVAEIKKLSKGESIELFNALKKAKPVGPVKYKPDFFIFFKRKTDGTQKLKVNGSKIKGYKNDFAYEIQKLDFLNSF